jgi:ketosteroid isomerase-like protein
MISAASLTLFSTLTACNAPAALETHATDKQSVRAADARWSKAAGTHDLEATLGFYSSEVTSVETLLVQLKAMAGIL